MRIVEGNEQVSGDVRLPTPSADIDLPDFELSSSDLTRNTSPSPERLNSGERSAFNTVDQAITHKTGKLLFIDGLGGTGKTYLRLYRVGKE